MRLNLLLIILQTILVGTVTDSQTAEPIPNASVYYAGTKEGTTTDNDGAFYLRSEFDRKRTLVISAIGYKAERFAIEPNRTGAIEAALREQTAVLQEVTVTPGVNPAFAVLDSLRKHHQKEGLRGGEAERQRGYSVTTKLSLSNFTAKQLERHLWKQFEGMMKDSMVTLYERVESESESESQSYILTATDYEALIPEDRNLDFFQNNISLGNKAFLSPLASAGKAYYNYYLVESESEVRLDFKTKNPFYPTLNGSMWLDTATWSITRLEASIPRNASINYLTGGRIKQTYVNQQLTEEYVSTVHDFAIKQDSSHIWPSVLVEHISKFKDESLKFKGASAHSDKAPPPLPPTLRFASWLGRIIATGYIPTGTALDFGHVQEILQVNQTEGVHVGIPLRTNERLWKNVSMEAAIGYGFKNRQFSGLGKISFNLPSLRRNILSIEYRDHNVWEEVDDFTALMRENGVGYGTMDFTAYAFEALRSNPNCVNSLVRRQQFQIATENDWSDHVETSLYLRLGRQDTGNRIQATGDSNPQSSILNPSSYTYTSFGGIVRVGFGERKVDSYFRRVHVYGKYPVVYFGAELGSWSPYSSTPLLPYSHVYGKLTLMVRQTVNLGMGGELDYVAQIGTTLGQVPFALLHHFEGNQGYAYDPYRFTLMNNLQYNAKHFCALHLNWNGQGVLFNLIPGIRYLRLRELVTFKLAANLAPSQPLSLSASQPFCLSVPTPLLPYSSTPYIELGCGIGNILRVMDLHSVWRLTNKEDPTTPRWALRFRIHLGL